MKDIISKLNIFIRSYFHKIEKDKYTKCGSTNRIYGEYIRAWVTQAVRRLLGKKEQTMQVSKIAILIERYKKVASVDECKIFFHPAQKELKVLQNAKQSVYLTAFGVGVLAFFAGFGICWLVFVR